MIDLFHKTTIYNLTLMSLYGSMFIVSVKRIRKVTRCENMKQNALLNALQLSG
jgi:hypothetical protein